MPAGTLATVINVGRYIQASATWNPANILDGDSETLQITGVTGASLGDFVQVSFSLDLEDLQLTAYVQATGVVECVLQNNTGAARDLASGTVTVRVEKK
jgi:hypothetical protein